MDRSSPGYGAVKTLPRSEQCLCHACNSLKIHKIQRQIVEYNRFLQAITGYIDLKQGFERRGFSGMVRILLDKKTAGCGRQVGRRLGLTDQVDTGAVRYHESDIRC